MPELPDLIYIEKKLNAALPGNKINDIVIKEPIILRVLVPDNYDIVLSGASFKSVYRKGPFLGFKLDAGIEIIVHPMLAGRFMLTDGKGKAGRDLCLTINMESGSCLHYLDNKKMGKVYITKTGQYENIPRFNNQGIDILSAAFTLEKFQQLIDKQRKQVRVFLMDQTMLSAIGNAYADEILFDAGLHPKTFCNQLDSKEKERLYHSIVNVMKWGITEVDKAQQPIEVKVREHVRVRNRKDQPCPKCGNKIRRAGVLGYDTFFCPTCQPAKRKQFIDWA